MSAPTWLRSAALVSGTGDAPQRDMALAIAAGLIVDVRPWASLSRDEQNGAHDLGDATLAPGFIDAHVHLLFTCEVDHDTTRARFKSATDAELSITGTRNAHEALLGGITTVRDCGDTRGIVAAVRDAEVAGTIVAPRILTAGAPLTTTGGHLHWCGNTADSVDEVRRAVRQLCTSGVDLLKIMSSGGSMTRESDPHRPQFTAEEVTVAVSEAHRFGRHVAAHAQNAESIRIAVAAGVDTLEHCLWRDSSGSPVELDELIELLAPSTSSVVITLAGIARALLPGNDRFGEVERAAAQAASRTGNLAEDFRWARILHDSGINVVLASDAGVRFTPFRDFIETIRCGVVGLDVTPAEAIGMATGAAARAIGIGAVVGTLRPGLRADLVVLEGSDIDHRIGAVREVYRDGVPLVRDGRVLMPALG